MRSGPSGTAEAIVAILVPPACREEVLGDLHERYASPVRYAVEAFRTVPLVIVSRMRRTADPQVLLLQAFAVYLSFLGAARFKDAAMLRGQWGLLRLAIPAAMVLLGLLLDDTYAKPGPRSALNLARGPILGLALALASTGLAVPRWVMLYGGAMSLVLSCAIRMLFPPVTSQPLGANAPAFWLKQAGGPGRGTQALIRVLQGISAIIGVAIIGTWMAEHSAIPKAGIIAFLLVVLIGYQVSRRV